MYLLYIIYWWWFLQITEFSSTCSGGGLGMSSLYKVVGLRSVSHSFPELSPFIPYPQIWLIYGFVTLEQHDGSQSPLEQELLTIPDYLGFPSVSSVRAVRFVQLLSLHVFNSVLWCLMRFLRKTTFGFSSPSILSGVTV